MFGCIMSYTNRYDNFHLLKCFVIVEYLRIFLSDCFSVGEIVLVNIIIVYMICVSKIVVVTRQTMNLFQSYCMCLKWLNKQNEVFFRNWIRFPLELEHHCTYKVAFQSLYATKRTNGRFIILLYEQNNPSLHRMYGFHFYP